MKSLRLAALAGTLLLAVLSTGCATPFVDGGLKDVPKTDYLVPPEPQPVQLLFTFKTKGTANARATKFLTADVTKAVNDSGLFSQVSDQPVSGGAVLSIVIDNIPVTDDAFSKGFATGLTFGLAGSQVTDGYVCTLDYVPATGRAAVQKKLRHAIHTNIGNKAPPKGGVKAKSLEDAVRTMNRQIVGNGLKDLAADPAFLP